MSLSGWVTTFTLIFGGCCSNAITLEQITSRYPQSGSLITFCQFALVSLYGLAKHVTFSPPASTSTTSRLQRIPYPRLKPRVIPILPYFAQVSLFYVISQMNNAAFGYHVPLSVHIMFRSGGVIVSMLLGWLWSGKRYSPRQIFSVLLVTAGMVITTLSAAKPSAASLTVSPLDLRRYFTGIALLCVALFLSGCLGLIQEWTYVRYRSFSSSDKAKNTSAIHSPPWQESLFYIHFLSMPMFFTVRSDLLVQWRQINASPHLHIPVTIPPTILAYLTPFPVINPETTRLPFGLTAKMHALTLTLSFPRLYLVLFLNTLTSLVCVAGANRLTTSVSNLTVTLVLAVRKAVSLVLSMMLFDVTRASNVWLWAGAVLVMIGIVLFAADGREKVSAQAREKVE